jgi:hypothetical protein
MDLRTVKAMRYVTPLREGGSLPAIVEANDDGLYVLKFRGAGQGAKALIAELIVGELGRALELPVPEIVFVDLDPVLARTEPDPEIQDLIRASAGLNLALDYLPGSITFDPVVEVPDRDLASAIVWFDAFVTNVDRTPRNTNLLIWHRKLWLIDHGAALYFTTTGRTIWGAAAARSSRSGIMCYCRSPRTWSRPMQIMSVKVTPELIEEVLALIPDSWLVAEGELTTPAEHRAAYARYLLARLAAPRDFVKEALDARVVSI